MGAVGTTWPSTPSPPARPHPRAAHRAAPARLRAARVDPPRATRAVEPPWAWWASRHGPRGRPPGARWACVLAGGYRGRAARARHHPVAERSSERLVGRVRRGGDRAAPDQGHPPPVHAGPVPAHAPGRRPDQRHRGAIIYGEDLLAALNQGLIAGAGLDVTDPEPLPAGHPLWTHPRAIVTPHTAGGSPRRGRPGHRHVLRKPPPAPSGPTVAGHPQAQRLLTAQPSALRGGSLAGEQRPACAPPPSDSWRAPHRCARPVAGIATARCWSHRPARPPAPRWGRRCGPRASRVAGRGAGRNRACLPGLLLERRPLDIERQIETERRFLHETDDPGHQALEAGISTDHPGPGESTSSRTRASGSSPSRSRRPLLGGRDQDGAQRALTDGEPDRGARPAGAKRGRSHAEHFRRRRIEASIELKPAP